MELQLAFTGCKQTQAVEFCSHCTVEYLSIRSSTGGQAILTSNDAFLLPDSIEAARAKAIAPDTVGLAEFASFMVEWRALAARTSNAAYADVADDLVDLLRQRYPKQVRSPS